MRNLLLLLLVVSGINASAQKATPVKESTTDAPYLKYRDLPAFDIVYLNGKDTFSTYNIPKGKPSIIINFSPDCDHCKKMFDALLPQMEKLKNVNVYVISFMPVIAMEIFNRTYHLEKYENIKVIGQDIKFFFPTFYSVTTVPNIVLYDKNKKLVKLWPDGASIEQILAELK